MGELELTPRLRQAAQWVPQGVRLADIGTDHGHLPIWLMLQGRIQSAIAADLRPGPLSRARENARRYGVTGIDFRLCDGLSAIRAEECDAVVIAGMGGENIAAILAAAPWTLCGTGPSSKRSSSCKTWWRAAAAPRTRPTGPGRRSSATSSRNFSL